MLRRLGIALVCALIGAGAAFGVAACGEDREGEVQFEDGGTGTERTATAGTGTETAATETDESGTGTAETAP